MQLAFLTQWFSTEVMKALTWTFVHSLWQGLLAALLAAVIISATRRTSAKLRYHLLGAVLILFLAASFITFFIALRHQEELANTASQLAGIIPDSNNTESADTARVTESFLVTLTNWFNANTGLILSAWALLFSLNCLKLITGLAGVNRLRNYKTYPVTEEWTIRFEQLRNNLGIRRSVTLLQSGLVKVPVALGYLKPIILLPVGLLANIPAEQVETILLHELGHIRRKDYLVNFIQHFMEAVFFFNPGLRWISSLLRQEREACCDDIVVANSGQKRNYLDALVAFQAYSFSTSPYAMAISSKRDYLLNRVKRILTNENKGINLFEKLMLLAGIILFSAFVSISKEEGSKELIIQPLYRTVLPAITINPAAPPVKKEKKIIRRILRADTLPVKKDTTRILPPASLAAGEQAENTGSNADKTLKEIIQLKEQIGIKKESIGKKKEQLPGQEGQSKNEILKEIEKERGEIDVQRGELDKKRTEYDRLKKQEEKNKEREKEQEKKAEDRNKKLFTNGRGLFKKKIDYPAPKRTVEFKIALKKIVYDRQVKPEPKIKLAAPEKLDEKKLPEKPLSPKTKPSPASPVKV